MTICHIAWKVAADMFQVSVTERQHRGQRVAPDVLDAAVPDAEQADAVRVAEPVGEFGQSSA